MRLTFSVNAKRAGDNVLPKKMSGLLFKMSLQRRGDWSEGLFLYGAAVAVLLVLSMCRKM